ncbi:8202_t:CDS:2, partial [Cetraspora pellucida]
DECIREAMMFHPGVKLQHLFAIILLFCEPTHPDKLWHKYKHAFTDDILSHLCKFNNNPHALFSDAEIEDFALRHIQSILQSQGRSIEEFPYMPIPSEPENFFNKPDRLICEELNYDASTLKQIAETYESNLNQDQLAIFSVVTEAIKNNHHNCIFVDGLSGSGKTYLYAALLAWVRGQGLIALAVASSGIAALLLDGEFSNWLLKVGNGTVSILNDIDNIIDLPPDIVLPSTSLQDLISIVYPNLLFLFETPELLLERAILVPRNKHVNEINDIIIESLPTTIIHSFSADTLDPASTSFTQLNLFPVELLNSFTPSGFPPHDLKLKVGSPILLLCNINQEQGLCNGTRLICKAIHKRVLEAEFLQGPRVHTRILLPRITFLPKPGDLPFKFI